MSLYNLYNLPKDILVDLVAKIQRQTQEEYQKKIDELSVLLAYHNPHDNPSHFTKYYCSENGCEFFCYGKSSDLLNDDDEHWFCFSVNINKKEIYEDISWVDVSCLSVNDEFLDPGLFSSCGIFCRCCKTWYCHKHFENNIEKHEKHVFVCKTCCQKGCKF